MSARLPLGSAPSSQIQRPTQLPVFFCALADHQGATWMLARQVNVPLPEIRAVTLPFTSVHQVDAP